MIPNRYFTVDAICRAHPEAFVLGDQHDATRLKLLREVIIPRLNVDDEDNWGLLTKTDQPLPEGGYRIPCDVLVWRPTMETVDCLTKTGAAWIVRDPPPKEWVWTSVDDVPVPHGSTGYDEDQVKGFIDDAVQLYTDAHAAVNPYALVWVARMQFDAVTLGYPASRAKHLDELRAALK